MSSPWKPSRRPKKLQGKPHVIVLHTVKGKGLLPLPRGVLYNHHMKFKPEDYHAAQAALDEHPDPADRGGADMYQVKKITQEAREMRAVFAEVIADMAEKDSRVIYLDCDLMNSIGMAGYWKEHPDPGCQPRGIRRPI